MFREIMKNPENMFKMLRIDLKKACEEAVTELLKVELTAYLQREKYERSPAGQPRNYRNGYYRRYYTAKGIGTLNLRIPRARKGNFRSRLLHKYERYDKELEKDLCLMFLSGLSTRSISLLSKRLIGRKISHSEVSHVNKELMTGVEQWRERPLDDLKIKYMYVDGTFFEMRTEHKIEKVPMLIVVGVTHDNHKVFLNISQGDKESASTWREVFKDLKRRGLDKNLVELGIMDGLPGLEKVFEEEFSNARIQRCQFHLMANIMSKTPKSLKGKVKDEVRDIFYAPDKKKAKENYGRFLEKYHEKLPSVANCLKRNIDRALTFYAFDPDHWISIRTTNVIERVNKEFKRRTKPMEILAGEASAYRLLSFIALKMELNWRKAPLGRNNLPNLDQFTQKT
jgi:putative transposase